MTSHPRDFDSEIVRVIDENINLCEWIHLPVQSGSDRVLRMMRRGYTRGEYLQKIQLIKNASRSISITSDIIIGFPGETDQDFAETLNLVSEVEFDGLYIFKYSPRPKTPASAYPDSVSDEVKAERFMKLQELQMRLQKIKYAKYIGVIIEVLVEGGSTRSKADMFGHSRCNKIVNFPCDSGSLGKIVNVRVTGVRQNSLYGTIV